MQYNAPTGSSDSNADYVGKNLAAGQQGSKIPPTVPELVQRELVGIITASGQSPSNSDTVQVLKAVRTNALSFYSDTGTADALIITPSPAFTAIPDGAEFAISKKASAGPNATPAPSLAVNGISRPIVKEDGTALAPGDLAGLFTVRALGGQFRVVGLRKSDGGVLHIGDDVSSTASQITADVSPSIAAYVSNHVYSIGAAHDCPGGAVTAVLDGVMPGRPVKRCDGSSLVANDWKAGDRLILNDDGTSLRIVGLTKLQAQELAGASTTVQTAIFNLSPGGLTSLTSAAGLQQQSDIAAVPNFTTVFGSGSFTGAGFVTCQGACALRAMMSSGGGGTVRFGLFDEAQGIVVATSPYVGGGSPTQGNQSPYTVPGYVFKNLDGNKRYHVVILAQKGSSDPQTSTWDPSIFAQHNGSNA